ncbi:MAG: hypothetical protein ISF22_00180 [Methanomassiliicoccus sp.]|nr:hypothetical protein [Methanomassiliicoccus sp.]
MTAQLTFINDDTRPGTGMSSEISRGLSVHRDGEDLLQEGLGLGAIALKKGGVTYFPTSSTTWRDGPLIIKEFPVDSALIFESPILPLSRLMSLYGLGTRVYMTLPRFQDRLLEMRSRLFSKFEVRPVFRRTAPLATAIFTYLPGDGSVAVGVTVRSTNGPLPEVFIMNELGAGHFDSSMVNGTVGSAPTGWCELPWAMPTPALADVRGGTTFRLERVRCGDGAEPRLYWGRERSEDLCWAGFEIELSNLDGRPAMSLDYEVRFGRLET